MSEEFPGTADSVNVAVVQDCRVLENDFVILSAYGNRSSAGVSLLIGRNLIANVNVVFPGDASRLAVADVAVKSFKFWAVAVYASNISGEKTFDGWYRSSTIRSG